MPYSQCCNGFTETIPENNICPSCLQECEFQHTEDILLRKKTFITQPRDRQVTVRVYENHVSFHYSEEGDREFYWFYMDDWKDPNRNWETHMEEKRWFTSEMLDLING